MWRQVWLGVALTAIGCNGILDTDGTIDGGPSGLLDADPMEVDSSVMAMEDAGTLDAGPPEPTDAGPADAGPPPDPPPPPPPCPRIRVTTVGISLNVRDAPRLAGAVVGSLAEGAIVDVVSIVVGDTVDGVDTWYEVATPRGFVSGRYSECTTDEPPMPTAGFYLPLACGTSARISQGNNSGFSHTGNSRYAFDFALARGTTLHAMADGMVSYVYDRTRPGDACYNGGGPECIARANMVWVRHADATTTTYAHLDAALVSVGTRVPRGTAVGRSGSSGYSTGPHAHVARQAGCSGGACPSIPLAFVDVPGSGVPVTGQTVTSGNCP